MPLTMSSGAPTLLLRRQSYERSGLVRSAIDEKLGLTADEFRVEGDVVAIGPIYDDHAFAALLSDLARLGLVDYDDFFELSGNWPDWLTVLVGSTSPGRRSPSQPHS
jgi:hypothetical protein